MLNNIFACMSLRLKRGWISVSVKWYADFFFMINYTFRGSLAQYFIFFEYHRRTTTSSCFFAFLPYHTIALLVSEKTLLLKVWCNGIWVMLKVAFNFADQELKYILKKSLVSVSSAYIAPPLIIANILDVLKIVLNFYLFSS